MSKKRRQKPETQKKKTKTPKVTEPNHDVVFGKGLFPKTRIGKREKRKHLLSDRPGDP